MYDAIVIGAGPSGSVAAKILAENGYKILLTERKKLPRCKSCSGILIKKSMDLTERYFGEAVPDFTTCAPAKNYGMIFTDDKGKEIQFRQDGLNIKREIFDNWLVEKAAEKGAQVRDSTSAVSCEERETSVIVNLHGDGSYTENAKYVIDCEGVTGAFKRKLVKTKSSYITTFQTFNEGSIDLDYHYFYAYLQPELSEYDAWFNVKDNFLALGVAVKDMSAIENFYSRFILYMKQKHNLKILRQVKKEKWIIPHIGSGHDIDYGVGRVLFAGEAAGFLNPMGEGISAGLESGFCAARAVAENFGNTKMIYSDYKRSTEKLKNYMMRQWSFVADIADTFKEMKI